MLRAVAAGQALAEESVTAIEVTFTVPDAPLAIARLAAADSERYVAALAAAHTPDRRLLE